LAATRSATPAKPITVALKGVFRNSLPSHNTKLQRAGQPW